MRSKLVYISADRLEALRLRNGILTDRELADRVGVYPSYICKVKAQGRCRQATAERLAKVLGWGFVECSPAAKGGYTKMEPYELPTLEGAQAEHLAHLLEQGKTVERDTVEALPGPGPRKAEPAAPSLEQTVRDFIARPIPERWPWYSIRERLLFWNSATSAPQTFAQIRKFPRYRVCAAEVWMEALGRPLDSLSRAEVKRINAIIAATPGWEKAEKGLRFGPYGFGRGFVQAQH